VPVPVPGPGPPSAESKLKRPSDFTFSMYARPSYASNAPIPAALSPQPRQIKIQHHQQGGHTRNEGADTQWTQPPTPVFYRPSPLPVPIPAGARSLLRRVDPSYPHASSRRGGNREGEGGGGGYLVEAPSASLQRPPPPPPRVARLTPNPSPAPAEPAPETIEDKEEKEKEDNPPPRMWTAREHSRFPAR
jgi:hypothetical protein